MSAPPSLVPAPTPPFWQPLLGMPQLAPLKYFAKLVRFALRTTPLWYLSALIALVSIGMEMLAMASLFPLTALAAGQPLAEEGKLIQALRFFGITPDVPTLLKLFLALFSLRYLTQLANMGLSLYLSKRMVAQISHRAFDVFIKDFTLRELEEKSIGYFIALAGDEANRASTVMASLNMFFSQALLAVVYFMAIVYYSPPMALAVATFLLVSFVSMLGVFKQTHRLGIRMVEQSRASGSLFIDALNGLRMVRAFSGEGLFSRRYQQLIGEYLMTQFHGEFLGVVSRTVPVLLLLGAFFTFSALAPQQLTSGMSFAFIITVILFLMRFFPTVGQCLNTFMRIISETKVGQDVTQVIERTPQHASDAPAPLAPVQTIALEDVGFSYDGRHPVLAGLSLTFERGTSYAIAGPSGCGKSTLLDLLLKFYPVGAGTIRINGAPIEAIDERALRKRLLLLGQETAIFNDTVFNNVAFGEPYSQAEVERACRLACVDQDIRALPDGYLTPLNYRGTNLSGGQRQRIGIARALLRGADVLILDESTSALDQATRSAVVDNILEAYHDRIVIFVTHDPYLIQRADVCFDLPSLNQASPRASHTPTDVAPSPTPRIIDEPA